MECQFCGISLLVKKLLILSPSQGGVYEDLEQKGFLYSTALQDDTIMLQGNVDEMPVYFGVPCSYTINDAATKFIVIKAPGSEKMQVIMMLAISAELLPCVILN
jgi:hypothetical protein